MMYCSRHDKGIMVAMVIERWLHESFMIQRGFQWKQLVLPGFDKIMGV